tara:strand:+ start:79 stop:243 length:165 start_codon:yes stop_codon:yes gene_type:complete
MKKLYRYPDKGYIGGVCHGLGEHTKVDPIIWRVLAILGPFPIGYIIFWIVLKKA